MKVQGTPRRSHFIRVEVKIIIASYYHYRFGRLSNALNLVGLCSGFDDMCPELLKLGGIGCYRVAS